MTTPRFDFDRDVNLPVAGRSPAARHSSATGAQYAARQRGQKAMAYLRVVARFHETGVNDFDASQILGIYRTSVNSIRNSLVRAGFVEETCCWDVTEWGTKRQRYRLTVKGRAFVEAQS